MSALVESVKGWLNAGLGLVYPEVCQLCGEARATPAESYVCRRCRAGVRMIQAPLCDRCGLPFQGAICSSFECSNCKDADFHFAYARSAAVARDPLLEVIHRYKYRQALWFEPLLGELLITAAVPDLSGGEWDWIVPVPLHPTKHRERGFNQAERLARRLSAATGLPLRTRVLRRTAPTQTQTLLTRGERRQNVRKAFALRGRPDLENRRIVLVDDVFTTGATTGECARVLRKSGAAEVCVWTVARGI